MIDSQTAQQVLEKILSSEPFSKSEFDQTFLKYLVNASLEGKIPKETTIAIDLFNKNSAFNPGEDSIVRTHIYSLRKKIDTYYLKDGKNDKVKLIIPKGRYEAHFINSPQTDKKSSNNKKLYNIIMPVLVALSILTAIFSWNQSSRFKRQILSHFTIKEDNPIWTNFLESDMPIIVVLGDYFVFWEKESKTGGDRKVRDGNINSEADLQQFLQKHPKERPNISDNRGSYLAPIILQSLVEIFPFLKMLHKKKVELSFASNISKEQLLSHNIIFIGPYKTLRILKTYLDTLDFNFQTYPHKVIIKKQQQQIFDYLFYPLPTDNHYRKDYSLVAKLPGKNSNIIMLIAAFSPRSVTETVNKLLNPNTIQELNDKYLKDIDTFPEYFQLLFEIRGETGEKMNFDIKYFSEIKQ